MQKIHSTKTSNPIASLGSVFIGVLLSLLLLLQVISVQAATLAFNFTLTSGATTSAGAYKTDGTLVRTLWRKVYYASGTHSYTWDGKDDAGADVPNGNYQFKVIAHNMRYVWDGAIGNTSQSQTGVSVHRAFYPMHDMAISGQNAFYVSGYNEGQFAFARFNTSTPQVVAKKWRWIYNPQFSRVENIPSNIYDRSWEFTATDGTRAYFAVPLGTNPTTRLENYAGFITASYVSDSNHAPFTNGVNIPEGPDANAYLASGIYAGTQPGISGLAVQASGSLLAASVAPDNKVYFFHKTTGAASGSITVTAPGRIEFAPNGDLWVTTGTSVVRYTLTGSPNVWTVATTITGFSKPLDVAVHPSNNNIMMVADGGSSQQVKAYNSTGTLLWTYGTAGGYSIDTTVANNKFWFHNDSKEDTFITIDTDGSFWVGDGGNRRSLHFSSSRTYIDQIAYVPHNYATSVDRNNPNRVFSEFLEFNVNYNQPAGSSWTLVKNWGAGLPNEYFTGFGRGLKQTVTLSNGRTYSTAWNNSLMKQMLLELNGTSTRIIGQLDQASGSTATIQRNGDLVKLAMGTPSWTQRSLTSFDGMNNPVWGSDTNIGSASNGATDPSPRCCSMGEVRAPITSSNVIVSYDQSMNNGFHLGGVSVGGNSWLWKAMPAVTSNVPLDGLGSYDIGDGVTFGGNTAEVADRHIVAGYHGEFYMSQGQAGQYMHFYDNGLFIGQFGEPSIGYSAFDGAVAGFAGNGFAHDLVKASNGEYYFWVNDESAHGPQRWHLLGANNIREFIGTGTLGGIAVPITAPAAGFPTNLNATPGNAQVALSWTGVTGASSYTVKYSTTDGGPYTSVTGITGTSYTKTTLTNGTRYYFVVSAIVSGVESSNSDQVAETPFNSGVVVQTAGQQTTIKNTFNVSSTAPAAGAPAMTGLSELTGDLTLHDVGKKGYQIFNWGGTGSDNTNVLSPFTVTKGSGWSSYPHMAASFKVNGSTGATDGLLSNPSNSIDISVSDTNFHYLTVFSPAVFADARTFTIKLTPQGQTSPVASYTLTNEDPGRNHIYQFLFKGNVTLTMDSTGGDRGTIQAIFLDDLNVTTPTVPSAPSGLTATAGNAQVSLSWTASSGATSYDVFRGTSSNGQSATAIVTNVTGTSYINTGLTNGTTYYYKVKAVNSAGASGNSNEANAMPVASPTAPSAPTGLSASASNTQVTLSWSAVSGAISYDIFRGTTSNGQSTTAIATGITATSYTNTGLTNGTTYYYKVKAVNSGGSSGNSNEASATPAAGSSGSGSVVTSVQYYPRQSWASRMTGGVFQGSNDNTNWTTLATISSTPTQGVYSTLSVSNTTAWRYLRYLSPTNSYGNVADVEFYNGATKLSGTLFGSTGASGLSYPQVFDSNTSTFFDGTAADGNFMGIDLGTGGTTPPSAPTGLAATSGNAQVSLSWTASSGATSYDIFRGTSSNGQSSTAIATGVTGTSYTNTGLTNATTYYYKIKAVNSGGSSAYSNEASATPLAPPSAPVGLTATAGNSQISLSWGAVSGTTSYDVFRGTSSNGQGSTAIAINVTTNSYTNTGLTNGTTYYYKVKAVNSAGSSSNSNEASATPVASSSGSVVTSVQFYPRQSWSSRMVGGAFQGSNDNSNWTTLATISTSPTQGTYSTLSVSNTTSWRYLRYLSPTNSYGNVAEIEFYNGTTKLSGTLFGSTGASGLSYPQVFDGNTSTFFDGAAADGNFMGIDLGP